MDRVRLFAVGVALLLAVLAPLFLGLAGMLAQSHMVSAEIAFHVLIAKAAIFLFALAALAAIVACVLAFFVEPKGGRAAALFSLVLSAAPGLMLSAAIARASGAAPIHDVATDATDPPLFSDKIAMLHSAKDNSLSVDPAATALRVARYPAIKPMPFAAPPASVFDAALKALQDKKLSIVTADKAAGAIEATTHTPWFGIEQDVIVRIRPTDTGSLIDIRAATRDGRSDYGANAQTIKTLQRAIKAQF